MKRLRRSILYVPGNNPGMIRDAHIYGSDVILLDLEDSVAMTEKDAGIPLSYSSSHPIAFFPYDSIIFCIFCAK